jgi:antitoxin HigA-1
MMKMYNPPHPGEIMKDLWLDPAGISITEAAQAMAISRKTLSKIVNGRARVTRVSDGVARRHSSR